MEVGGGALWKEERVRRGGACKFKHERRGELLKVRL